jgi:hypothetical protein
MALTEGKINAKLKRFFTSDEGKEKVAAAGERVRSGRKLSAADQRKRAAVDVGNVYYQRFAKILFEEMRKIQFKSEELLSAAIFKHLRKETTKGDGQITVRIWFDEGAERESLIDNYYAGRGGYKKISLDRLYNNGYTIPPEIEGPYGRWHGGYYKARRHLDPTGFVAKAKERFEAEYPGITVRLRGYSDSV